MLLEYILPALRSGKRIRRDRTIIFIKGDEIYSQEDGELPNVYWFDSDDFFFEDWEIMPDSERIADYLVLQKGAVLRQGVELSYTFVKETYPIGKQPADSVMVAGSERESNQELVDKAVMESQGR